MNINEMNQSDFAKLPIYKLSPSETLTCRYVVIVPKTVRVWRLIVYRAIAWLKGRIRWIRFPEEYEFIEGLHDSGYRCMDFVVEIEDMLYRLGAWSDVIHIEGIGGYGLDWLDRFEGVPRMIECTGWSMDCLPRSGFLRIFAEKEIIIRGWPLSSFEIWSKPTGYILSGIQEPRWKTGLEAARRLLDAREVLEES